MKSRNVKRLERGGQHSSSSSSSDGHDPYQSRSSSRSDKFSYCHRGWAVWLHSHQHWSETPQVQQFRHGGSLRATAVGLGLLWKFLKKKTKKKRWIGQLRER